MNTRGTRLKLLVLIATFLLFLSACSAQPTQLAQQVGAAYGDPTPTVTRVVTTTTDNSHQTMYLIFLQGHFSKGSLKATQLSFSALADGSMIWAIVASDAKNRNVWQDNKPPQP